ncbi:MAG TPA: alpha/beta fold hydrolase, partial [Verrucomicrobiae bacterium]
MNTARLHAWIAPIILLVGTGDAAAGSGKFDGLYYETTGRGETIVLIHGGQMDRRMWDAQFDSFARPYRVIRYDIRGFGKSDVPDKPYSHAGDLHSLLRHWRVKKATLMGLSLGAAIATDFAIEHPE